MASTYILYSNQLNKYYIGSTDADLMGRLAKHLSNHKGFTGKAKDWKIAYVEDFKTLGEARRRELQIKRWKSRMMIEKLVGNEQKGS